MLWSIDSCQNRISADQYHMTVPWAQVSTHRSRVLFGSYPLTINSFKWSQAQVYFFQWSIWNVLCFCHYGLALSRFWFQTHLGRENSASFLKIQAGRPFLTMVTRWSSLKKANTRRPAEEVKQNKLNLKLKDSGFLETLWYLSSWTKIVVSVNVSPNYISFIDC